MPFGALIGDRRDARRARKGNFSCSVPMRKADRGLQPFSSQATSSSREAMGVWSSTSRAMRASLENGADHRHRVATTQMARRVAGPQPRQSPATRLDEGERRDRGRVRPQDARPERKARDARQGEERRALGLVEAAFGADQHRERALRHGARARPRGRRRRPPRRRRRARVAASQPSSDWARRPSPASTPGTARTPHCSAASTALARMRSRLTRVDLRAAGDDRLERADAHLHRLLDHVVEPGMLERREKPAQSSARAAALACALRPRGRGASASPARRRRRIRRHGR